jgi:hypothetical protein
LSLSLHVAASPMINQPCQKRAGLSLTCVVALFSLTLFPVLAQDLALDALVRAYPDFLASHDGSVLIWKDGTRMSVSDGRSDKSFQEKLRNPSILDQLSIPYVKGPLATPPSPRDDPGRFRNIAFFDKMYGDCSKGQVQNKLTKVAWLLKTGGLSESLAAPSCHASHDLYLIRNSDPLRSEGRFPNTVRAVDRNQQGRTIGA